jgi:hypothetical protein
MRMQLIRPASVPPDGFRYVDPHDGFVSHQWSYDAWIDLQRHHLQANNRVVPPDLEGDMMNQLCQTLPPDWCSYDDANRPRVSTSLSWNDVVGGLQTFGKWIAGGCAFVDQTEADRRALICSRCFYNVHVGGCSSCQKMVEEVVRNKKSKYDFALKSCAVCHCFLRAKIHFKINDLEKDIAKHQDIYSQVGHCWLNKNGDNYKPD